MRRKRLLHAKFPVYEMNQKMTSNFRLKWVQTAKCCDNGLLRVIFLLQCTFLSTNMIYFGFYLDKNAFLDKTWHLTITNGSFFCLQNEWSQNAYKKLVHRKFCRVWNFEAKIQTMYEICSCLWKNYTDNHAMYPTI